MGFIALLIFLASSIALGQEVAELAGPPAEPINLMPVCEAITQATMTWPLFGQIVGAITAAALFLRPFSNVLLKVGLGLTAMPQPAAKAFGKFLWVVGTFASLGAVGTPPVMQKVYAGVVTPPVKNPLKKKPAA